MNNGPKTKSKKKATRSKAPITVKDEDFLGDVLDDFRQGHADSAFLMDEDISAWSPEKPPVIYSKDLSPKSYEKKFEQFEKAMDAIHDARCKVEQLERVSPTKQGLPAAAQTTGFSFKPRKLFD